MRSLNLCVLIGIFATNAVYVFCRSNGLPAYGIEDGDGEIGWRKSTAAYAKNAGIDLEATGCYAVSKGLEDDLKKVKPLKVVKKTGRWQLPKHVRKALHTYSLLYTDSTLQMTKYKKHGGFHGFRPYDIPGHDITKWSRKERAKWNFDKKDPLADISEKDLKEGNIMLG